MKPRKLDRHCRKRSNLATLFLIGLTVCLLCFDGFAPRCEAAATAVTGIAAGDCGTIVLKSDGTVWTWGYNYYGGLGNGTTVNSSLPVQVSGLSNVVAVAFGVDFALALKSDGTVWAWGVNDSGQLGTGTTVNSNLPVQVRGLSSVIAIASGANFALALRNDGTVWAWGDNESGQLGNGTTVNSSVPVQISEISNVVVISASSDVSSIALKSDGTVWAWGDGQYGQLGNGTTGYSSVPVQVSDLSNVITVASGGYSALALRSDGTLWAWGCNQLGELGNGTTVNSSVPVQVIGLTGVISVAGADFNSIALKNDGTVWTWGGNLGNGTTGYSSIPVQVSGLSGISAIAAGYDFETQGFTLALRSDGTVWTWGSNVYGQLGNGTTFPTSIPFISAISSPAGLSALTLGLTGYGGNSGTETGSVNLSTGGSCSTSWDNNVPGSNACQQLLATNTPVTLTVNPPTGYLSSWSGCDSVSGNECMVTMTTPKAVTAAFGLPCTITSSVTDPAYGSITPASATVADTSPSGTPFTITITPVSGYILTSLTVNGTNVTSNAVWNGQGAYTYTFNVTQNDSIQATFGVAPPPPPPGQGPALSILASIFLAAGALGVILWVRRKANA